MSELATNNVRPCNKVLYHHIKMQSMCIAFFPRLFHICVTCCIESSRMYATCTSSAYICIRMIPLSPTYASVYDTFELLFSLSFCFHYSVFFTYICRYPFSLEIELSESIFSKMSHFITSFLLLAMIFKVLIMEFILVFHHSWDLWPNPL